jgi:exopolysaccharide biosynthesis protein
MKTAGKAAPKSAGRRLLIFLLFELFFTCATIPLLIFYGPFEDVKRTVVGASWNTLNHQYIAKFFLADKAIERIVGSTYAVDPTVQGEQLQKINIDNSHDSKIDRLARRTP